MTPYRLLLTLVTLCTLLVIATPVSAQDIDLGNDGIDMDCDDFPERNAVEGYFAHDGGSAARNIDELDPDGDGIPCNEAIDDGNDDVGGFPLPATTAYCEPEHAGPFVGCTPWAGVTVTFVAIDTNYSATCTTAASERTASCSVEVPFGSTIEASIDPATIPVGYVLQGDSLQQLTIPDGSPEGVFGGPNFILLESDDSGEEDPAGEEPEYMPPVVGDEPQTDPEPRGDEGDAYVPPVVGDEPQTDPKPSDDGNVVQQLPNTGVGATSGEAGTSVAMILMLTVAALSLMAGVLGLRRSTR